MAMSALIGKIFGSEKAIGAAVSGISNSLDALVYTDEEKAQDAAVERQRLDLWLSTGCRPPVGRH